MREVRVDRGGDDLTADLLKAVSSVAESDDLGWTHKREVQRVEEEDDVLSCING